MLRDRGQFGQHLCSPVHQQHFRTVALQTQARLATTLGRQVLVVLECSDLVGRIRRAVAEQRMQQEQVQEAHGLGVDAHVEERVQVHQAHFHVLHAAFAQRMQRTLTGRDHALGTDGAVELVLDLQQAGVELVVVAPQIAQADRLIRAIGLGQCFVQGGCVALQTVVAHRQRGLGIALVAQAPHAQRGGVRAVHGAPREQLEFVLAAIDKAGTHGRRSAEQVQQQEGIAAEIADQAEVLGIAQVRQRPVVVDAGNRLHATAIAVAQTHAVHALGAAHVGIAVAAERNGFIGRQAAGHAGHPQHFVAMARQHTVHLLVDARELVQAGIGTGVRPRNQLDLRFAEVGGDVRVCERRAQLPGMRRERQLAVRQRAQAFLFHAAQHARQAVCRDRVQPLFERAHVVSCFSRPRLHRLCPWAGPVLPSAGAACAGWNSHAKRAPPGDGSVIVAEFCGGCRSLPVFARAVLGCSRRPRPHSGRIWLLCL